MTTKQQADGPSPMPADDVPRGAPLAIDPEEFRRAGHALVDSIAAFLSSLLRRPLTRGESPAAIRARLDAGRPLPQTGMEAASTRRQRTSTRFQRSWCGWAEKWKPAGAHQRLAGEPRLDRY